MSYSQLLSATRDLPIEWWAVGVPLLALATHAAVSYVRAAAQRRLMPPGPRGLPLLGNVFQLPQFQWFRFTEWKAQYGPIFSLNLAGQPVIVLNSFQVAADLLDRRSEIYSDRPRFIMGGEILTGGLLVAFTPYGDLWRRMRRAAHEGFNVRAARLYQPIQEKESTLLVSYLLKDGDAWDTHLKRSAASTVLSAVYGWPSIDASSDGLVNRINDLMHRLVHACLPGAFMVDIFPFMKNLPTWMAKWKREGLDWFRKDTAMFEGFMNDVRKKYSSSGVDPCFASALIENEQKYDLNNRELSWLAGTMFGAGAETTAAALSVFMLAMTLYPDVMRRAQAEIDNVVGRQRMPTFADSDNLPYIRAMVKEVLRWRPVGPLSLPRRTLKDDWYNGYFIPKGTVVITNVWAMNRDPEFFPDYDEFRPERFLDGSGTVDWTPADTHSQGHLTYGCGRRVCIGMNLANQALFIDMASILWAMSIERKIDANGKQIIPSKTEFVDEGLVVRPVPFECVLKPRANDVASVVEMTLGIHGHSKET